jgi:hypothetical protein
MKSSEIFVKNSLKIFKRKRATTVKKTSPDKGIEPLTLRLKVSRSTG